MIKLLDKSTIDKIAAGEVIERPSSVVKELLENSVDAGATSITVEIRDGGLSLIRVTDNGCGIPKDEVQKAYMRHATSKIERAEDLNSIHSLGFRGEALSTIAAVSQTEMITKTVESLTGVKYVIHGGQEIELSEVGVPDGTTIVVRNLFYNTPARKKFLKSPMTEGSYINDLVLKLALSHPDISFKLIVNGQSKIDTAGNGNVKDTVYQLFGRDITSNLIPVSYQDDHIKISGFIGKPFISRGNRGLENYFINQRYIKSSIVNRAIEEGYKTFVMQHKFPFTILYIELPTDKCDVNVHPTKMEFKYDNERELFEVITHTVRDALTHKEIIPKDTSKPATDKTPDNRTPIREKPAEPYETVRKNMESQTSVSRKPQGNVRAGKYSPTYRILEALKQQEKETEHTADNAALNLIRDSDVKYESSRSVPPVQPVSEPQNNISISNTPKPNTPVAAYVKNEQDMKRMKEEQEFHDVSGTQASLFDDDFLTEKARKKHRLIGQLFDTYWLIEYEKNLYIMDQHAAHEKVNYEKLLKNLHEKEIYSQQLMPPMIITVSFAERQAIMDNFDLFMKIGYDIEEFGGNEFKINAVPGNLYGLHGREMFLEFVGSLVDNSGYMSNDIFIRKLSTMACKASVKGNMKLSFAEADALIDQLLQLDNPYTCPHGRPTIISISEAELEKKFKRTV
ncbi:MAG: DNA mismatch repair endonuclease MutL [Wujia sp.]